MGAQPIDERTCDTSGMLVIHEVLRRRFAALPGLVRSVRAGDRGRAATVGAHVEEFAALLHEHHATEDARLWGTLESRAPACALHVGRMRSQHRQVADLLVRVRSLVPAWELDGDPALRDALAAALDEVDTALGAHLGDEERSILPVAGATMSQQEWDAFGELGRKAVPKARLLVQLGYVLDTIEPSGRAAWMRANLPGPVRALYRAAGHRQFAADYRHVFGADPA